MSDPVSKHQEDFRPPQGLIHSDPVALKAKRLQASSLNPASDCRRTHPGAPRCFLNRDQHPVILGSLAVEIDIAGSGHTLECASQPASRSRAAAVPVRG
jgi:hypothetical protein